MTHQYMVLRWQDDTVADRALGIIGTCQVSGMRQVSGGARWSALTALDTDCVIQNHDIVIGSLHQNSSKSLWRHGNPDLPVDRARHLCAQGWGAYIAAFILDDMPWLMADPSGARPSWRIDADGLTIFTDAVLPSLAKAMGITVRINRSAVAASLIDPASATHLAFAQGIKPLTPGVLYGPGNIECSIWRPDYHTSRHVDNHTLNLRDAVDDTASALAEPATLFQLSGGLDSSILLTSLASQGMCPLAMNFATSDAGGDERRYAQLVARHTGTDLIEVSGTGFPDYRRLAKARQGAAPYVFGLDDAFERAVDGLVATHQATSVMTGQGGDAVFFQPATPLVSVDHARAAGIGATFWRALPDAARRTRSSIWPHLFAVIRDQLGTSSVPTDMLGATMLTAEALTEATDIDRRHPWSRNIDHLPPGKRMQIVMIANSQIFHHARATGTASLRHPLLTQPVLEVGLGIPTFVLAQSANDRGFARKVFSDRLPAALLARRTKGDASDHYSRAALANLDFLREFLLDGRLVAMGVLQREALDAVLTREALFFSPEYRSLAMQVSCEAWVRAWTV